MIFHIAIAVGSGRPLMIGRASDNKKQDQSRQCPNKEPLIDLCYGDRRLEASRKVFFVRGDKASNKVSKGTKR